MCGITGIYLFNDNNDIQSNITQAIAQLNKRGPDANGKALFPNVALGHCRLSIIDTSANANQPFYDESQDYVIVYNGECFNFKELKEQYLKGYSFKSTSDTEVVLQLYKQRGIDIFNLMNGFWALAIYDIKHNKLIISRDRYGEKPLYYYYDNNFLAFASELKSLMKYPIIKQIDYASLYTYLQLTYIPAPDSIFKDVRKLNPGHYIEISNNNIKTHHYYQIEAKATLNIDYNTATLNVKSLLEDAVEKRLMSDVPIGTFLSGGIDSSIVTALASKHIKHLNTFSVGFKNNKYFDETYYAKIVADKYKTNHTIIQVDDNDIFENIFNVLDYIDEPFADSSAIPMYMLSQNVSKYIKVSLSGDGADELFGGYNKHRAEYIMRHKGYKYSLIRLVAPFVSILKSNRSNKLGDLIRKISKFYATSSINNVERYRKLCSFTDVSVLNSFVLLSQISQTEAMKRLTQYAKYIKMNQLEMNDFLVNDMQLVLPNDMLYKVDMMSMANSLEVRSPFMDFHLVDYVMSLPSDFKINQTTQKRILKDAFADLLPNEILNRSKHGFEIPLLDMFANHFREIIEKDLLNEDFVRTQGIFDCEGIKILKNKILNNVQTSDIQSLFWSIIVFQYWWKKYFEA